MASEDYSKYAENWENKRAHYQAKQKFKEIERDAERKTKTSDENNRDKIDEIKDRLDIVDVIEKSIKLHHIGGNEYAGTVGTAGSSGESLKVDKDGQQWKDFKNGPGGDVFDWIGYINRLDTRGADFPEVLRIAADLAGVELGEMTEVERNAAKEKADIHNLFTAAAENYHKNLTPELYDHILQKWGITRETVNKFKIGYANTGRNLKNLDNTTLKKSGLVFVNGGMTGGEVFRGRIIFPYWKNGKVVYLIGRETEETPEAEREKGMKYKKLLVHKEGHEYVSSSVQNSYFYGEDSLRGSDYCIITEGVADCIALLQAGFPCISPVTVQFREKDNPKLISLTRKLNRVYICNDNEANKAGLKGALNTAEALESAGIETRLITLPKPEGLDKIDIADYMKEHSEEDFKELMNSSLRLWDYKLNQQVIKPSSTSIERLRAFRAFISNDLHLMQLDEWQVFVNNEVPKTFGLSKKDVKTTIEEVTKNLQANNKTEIYEPTEKEEEKTETSDRLKDYPKEIRELAYQILNEGDAFNFILETWGKLHAGDKNIGENLLCSVACTQITNAKLGLHQKPSGEFGSGKSDSMKSMVRLMPAHKCIEGSISSKTLFYDEDLKTGTIVYVDDAKVPEDTIVTLRAITSDFQEPAIHRTLTRTRDGGLIADKKVIPPRITIWMTSVESIQDQQLESRFCFGDTDESQEQDKRVNDKQKERVTKTYTINDDPDVLTCRCIFDIIFQDTYTVYAPLVEAIEWNNKEHRRNFEKFMDMLQAVTVFNFKQRAKSHGGIVANIDDYDRALKIYMGMAAKNATNLNGRELKVIEEIQRSPGKTISFTELLTNTGIKQTTLRYLMDGRNGKEGLLGKVAGLYEIDRCEIEGTDNSKISTKTKVYKYEGDLFGVTSKIYQTVASIDRKNATQITNDFISSDAENIDNNHNYHTTITNDVIVKNDNSKDNNNNKINKITKSQECIRATENNNIHLGQEKERENTDTLKSCDSCDFVIVDPENDERSDNLECDGSVILDKDNVIVQHEKSNSSISSLLRRALKKFVKDEYHNIVENLQVTVGEFNKRNPEFKERLGPDAIMFNAEQLSKRGWN